MKRGGSLTGVQGDVDPHLVGELPVADLDDEAVEAVEVDGRLVCERAWRRAVALYGDRSVSGLNP